MRAALLGLLAACGGSHATPPPDDGAPPPPIDARADAGDVTRPQIVASSPADDEADRPITQAFTVTFSEAIDPATVTPASLYMFAGAGPHLAGTLSGNGAQATFTPAVPLEIETRYNVTIEATVADLSGNTLLTDHTFRFNTVHRRRVFVTSIQNSGRLAGWPGAGGKVGLAAGDAVCQSRAVAANLDGTFVAWLSDDTHDAYCRVQGLGGTRATKCGQATLPAGAGPWVRVDGQPWGDRIDLVTDPAGPRVYTPPLLNELGQPAPATFFSSTTAAGTAVTNCLGWTSSAFGGVGYGGTRTTGTSWTQWGTTTCANFASLLCVELGASGIALQFPAAPSPRAFVTSTVVAGDLGASPDAAGATGLAAADAICRARAAAAGVANAAAFKAWLSDDATPAPARIVSNGPWARLDGIAVASSKLDLVDGQLATTLNQTETGSYLPDVQAWTDTTSAGISAAASCANWTAASGALGFVGRASDSGPHWTRDAQVDCAIPQRLYCLED